MPKSVGQTKDLYTFGVPCGQRDTQAGETDVSPAWVFFSLLNVAPARILPSGQIFLGHVMERPLLSKSTDF